MKPPLIFAFSNVVVLVLTEDETSITLETDIPATLTAPKDPVDIAEPLNIPKLPLPITPCQEPLTAAGLVEPLINVLISEPNSIAFNWPNEPVDIEEPLILPSTSSPVFSVLPTY